MSCHSKEKLEQMLFDVVDALCLSDGMIEKHGPLGTEPAELVRAVLHQKDLEIKMLRQEFTDIRQANNAAQSNIHYTDKESQE